MLSEPVTTQAGHPWLRTAFPLLVLLAAANLIGALVLAPDRGGDFAMLYDSTVRWQSGQPAYVSTQATTNLNHPLVWLAIAPLTRLSPSAAFVVWTAISLVALTLTVVAVCRSHLCSLTAAEVLVVLLALTGAGFEMGLGQIAFVLAMPFTAAWWSSRTGRPIAAGAWIGLLCVLKPFFGVYAIWMLARRQWRTVGAIAVSAALAAAAGVVLAGPADMRQWLSNLGNVTWTWHVFNASVFGVASRLLDQQQAAIATAWTPLLVNPAAARVAGWIAAALVLAALVNGLRHADHDTSFALLALGALLMSPLGWNYYLPTIFAPVLAALDRRSLPWWSLPVALCAVCPYAAIVNRHYGVLGTMFLGQVAFVSVLGTFMLVRPHRPESNARPE